MSQYVKTSLVTGGSGFVGRHLVRALLQQNRRVLALSRQPNYLCDIKHPLFQVIPGDLEEVRSYAPHMNDKVTVFHLASVRISPGISPERTHQVNETACIELGRFAVQASVEKFVYVSSAMVYGPSNGQILTEEDGYCQQIFRNLYIRSRVQALEEMQNLGENGLPLVTVCPTIVFGPDHPTHPNRVTSHLRRLLLYGVDLVIKGGHQKRNLVYIADVVRGILLAERFGQHGEVFILGGEDLSHRKFNQMALSLARRKPRLSLSIPRGIALAAARFADRLRSYDCRSGYEAAISVLTKEWRYSSHKAKQYLGYTSIPIREAILKTMRFIDGGPR